MKKKKSNPQENKSQEIMLLSSRIDSLTYLMGSMSTDFATRKEMNERIKDVKTDCNLGYTIVCIITLGFVLLLHPRVTDMKTPAAEPVNATVTNQYPIPGIEGNFLNVTELTGGKSFNGEK